MRIATLLGAAATAALLAACGLGAPAYPSFGEADYRIEGATTANGVATNTVIYRDGPKMRVEAALPGQAAGAVVFDQSTNAAYVLNPTGQTQPTQQAPASVTPAAPPASNAAPTAAPMQIAGVAVRVPNANAPQPMESAWAALGADNARHVGRCTVAGEDGQEWRPRTGDVGVRTACITQDGIVLRVTQDGAPLWEATALHRGDQDPALFGVPANYRVIDPQTMAEQVSESFDELDSVTGAPPAPPQAPDPRG